MSVLRDVDLNLLVALDALLAERSVTRAARRVGLSQPAMSNALARLRRTFDDPLLVRSGASMVPTPRALSLAAPVREALSTLELALESLGDFEPAQARRTFTLAASDYAQLVMLPRLVQRLAERAPRVGIRVAPAMGADRLRQEQERGRVDLAIGVFPHLPPGHQHLRLFTERFVTVARAEHPALEAGLDLDAFCALRHVVISPRGDGPGMVDRALEHLDRQRTVGLRIPGFVAALSVVARTDLLLTVAERVLTDAPGLAVYPPPVALPAFAVGMVWHDRTHHDPAQCWLRRTVAGLFCEEPLVDAACGPAACAGQLT